MTQQTAAAIADQSTGELNHADRHALAVMQPHPLLPAPPTDFSPRSMDEALRLCDMLADSDLVPKDFQRKPANCFVAIQWGAEVGLKPMQSLQNIAVINGRPSMWGDAQLALVRSSPHCEYVYETWDEHGTAICRAKRRGEPMEHVVTFSIEDQKTAGLAGKAGPHTQYPKRMRQLRARAFCLRDTFTDVLRGIPQTEEVLSYAQQALDGPGGLPRNATPAQIAAAASPKVERTDGHAKIIEALELKAFNHGSAALAEAWKALTKDDRVAVGQEELRRLQAIAKECDAIAAGAASAASQEPGSNG